MAGHLCNWLHCPALPSSKIVYADDDQSSGWCLCSGRHVSPFNMHSHNRLPSCKAALQPNSNFRALARETCGLICSILPFSNITPIHYSLSFLLLPHYCTSAPDQFIRAMIPISKGAICHSMQWHSYLRISISRCYRY